jgi:hypothetical protein
MNNYNSNTIGDPRDDRDDRQPYQRQNSNNRYQNNKPFNHNKFNSTKPFNPNTINELRDKFIKITWKDEEIIDWNCFKVLNTYYAYGDGWVKLLVIDNGNNTEKEDIPQELLENPIFIRIDDIKYFMIITEK